MEDCILFICVADSKCFIFSQNKRFRSSFKMQRNSKRNGLYRLYNYLKNTLNVLINLKNLRI